MRIVCATDLLPRSEAAIDRAGLLADRFGADLTLLHVVEPNESERASEQALQTSLARVRARAQPPLWRGKRMPEVAVRTGDPGRIIVEKLADYRPDLLILGPHRKRPLQDALRDTVVERALAARICPVLVVQDEAQTGYRRVLLALDLSSASASAVAAFESLMLTPDVDATVVHAYEPPYQGMLHYAGVGPDMVTRYSESWKREARKAVRELLDNESTRSPWYDIVIEPHPAATGILRALERYEPDLLVMGTHGGGRLRRALVGSVSNRILQGASCDVLIAPDGWANASRGKTVWDMHGLRRMPLEPRVGEQPLARQARNS
jgi:universal stress protein E